MQLAKALVSAGSACLILGGLVFAVIAETRLIWSLGGRGAVMSTIKVPVLLVIWALTVAVAFVGADVSQGYLWQNSRRVNTHTWEKEDADRAYLVLAGFGGAASAVGAAIEPGLRGREGNVPAKKQGSVVAVDSPQRGYDSRALYKASMKAIRGLKKPPEQIFIDASSLGGAATREWLGYYERDGKPFGPVVLILDHAVGSRQSVKDQKMLALGRYPGGPLSSWIYRQTTERQQEGWPGPEADDNPDFVQRHYAAIARAGTPRLGGQLKFLDELQPMSRKFGTDLVAYGLYITSPWPETDPVVDNPLAIREWGAAIEGGLIVIYDPSRKPTEHNPQVEHRRSFWELVANNT